MHEKQPDLRERISYLWERSKKTKKGPPQTGVKSTSSRHGQKCRLESQHASSVRKKKQHGSAREKKYSTRKEVGLPRQCTRRAGIAQLKKKKVLGRWGRGRRLPLTTKKGRRSTGGKKAAGKRRETLKVSLARGSSEKKPAERGETISWDPKERDTRQGNHDFSRYSESLRINLREGNSGVVATEKELLEKK